jgi:hypothetical protein
MLLLALAPGGPAALAAVQRNGTLAAGLRAAAANATGAPFEAALLAAAFDTGGLSTDGAPVVFATDAWANVAGNAPDATAALAGALSALDIPSTSSTESASPAPAGVLRRAAQALRGGAGENGGVGADTLLDWSPLNATIHAFRASGMAVDVPQLWLCVNVLGRVIGTVNESSVLAMAARAAEAAASGALAIALAPALAVLTENVATDPGDAPQPFGALLQPPAVLLLPRVRVFWVDGGAAMGAAGGGPPGVPAGGIAAAALLSTCALLVATALRYRRRKAAVAPEPSPPPPDVEVPTEVEEAGVEEETTPPAPDAPPAAPRPSTRAAPADSLTALVARAHALNARQPLRGLALHEAAARDAAERKRRAAERHGARAAAKEAADAAALLLEPAYRRVLLLKVKPDARKWWAAPNVKAKEAHLDTKKWGVLEKERAAALARGDPWPPPDPREALKHAGAKLQGGVWLLDPARAAAGVSRPASRAALLEGAILETAQLDKHGAQTRTVSSDGGDVAARTGVSWATRSRADSAADVAGPDGEGGCADVSVVNAHVGLEEGGSGEEGDAAAAVNGSSKPVISGEE